VLQHPHLHPGVLEQQLPDPGEQQLLIEIQEREGKRVVSDGGALESFLLEAATQNKTLDAEQLRFIQASRDKQQS
jgi:hypothetical protein